MQTNMKLAEEELRAKRIARNGTKTLPEKVEAKYRELLMRKVLRHGLKQRESYLVNGIDYIVRELESVAPMRFLREKEVAVAKEEVQPEEINLMALSLNDMVKPEEAIAKEAFVTANEREKHPPSEQDRLSEASKTNKMH